MTKHVAPSVVVRVVTGDGILPFLTDLARLRIKVFYEFPYLYVGDFDYESAYLRTYTECAESVLVLVCAVAADGSEQVVGASTGLPLAAETEDAKRPFQESGLDVGTIFYYGESVLLPEYRGLGLGVRFFEERERHARALGRFTTLCFCAVARPPDHPLRPKDYQPLDAFWTRRGFQRHDELVASYTWKDRTETTQSTKPLAFWMKSLES